MIPDLPSPLLRTFVAVVDAGSLAQAARQRGKSESALSLQIARLEDLVGRKVFDRDGRSLRLNPAGEQLLGHARAILARIDAARAALARTAAPIRIGIVQDFAGEVLRATMADLRAADARVDLEVTVAGTGALLKLIGAGELDVALCATELIRAAQSVSLQAAWFGHPSLLEAEVIPLISVAPPCPYLSAAKAGLDAAGRAYRLAVVTPSLDGVRAAVAAGLGIACRTEASMGMPALDHGGQLPPLPEVRYAIASRTGFGQDRDVAAILHRHLAALAEG